MKTIDLYSKACKAKSLDDFSEFWFSIFQSRQTHNVSRLHTFLEKNAEGLSMLITIIAAEVAFLSQSHLNHDEVLKYLVTMKDRMKVFARQNMSGVMNSAFAPSFIENILKEDKDLRRTYAFNDKGYLGDTARAIGKL